MKTAPLVALALLSFALLGCERIPPDAVAVVNDRPIKRYTFDAYLARLGQQEITDQQRLELLEQAIDLQVLSQEALRHKLDYDPAVAGELEVLRMSRLANALLRKHFDEHPITEDALRAEYARQAATLSVTEYRARHVLVPSEAEAREVVRQLDRGAKFERLARIRSTDAGSAAKGGDLDWFTPDMMVKPFSDAVIALEKGKYTKQPLQTQFGWHVIFKEGERVREPPPFDTLREQIQGRLQQQSVETYINALRGEAKILKRDKVMATAAATDPADDPAGAPASGG